MSTLSGILSIAASGLQAQQKAMNVTSHNIANATTEGYSRQRALIGTNPALITPDGVLGTGGKVITVQSLRDPLLDGAYFRELSLASQAEAHAQLLARVESLFAEPSDLGLADALDAFYSSWSELATDPTNDTTRALVGKSADTLTYRLQGLASGLDQIRQEVDQRLVAATDRANSLLTQIADLNRLIVSMEADGGTAGDLRDERSRALEELSGLIPITAHERQNGSMGVATDGEGLVEGAFASQLELRVTGGVTDLAVVGRTGVLPNGGGAISGLRTVANTELPSIRAALDALAANLVAEVNAIHQTGTAPNGATGIDFFDPAGVTAASIGLSAAILADPDAVAAGTPDGLGAYRAGANDIAIAIAGLRDTPIAALGGTTGSFYQQLVSDVGQRVLSSREVGEAQRVLADQADIRRQEVSGVSVDEELVNLIEFQRAYQASARTISAVDEMLASLLSI